MLPALDFALNHNSKHIVCGLHCMLQWYGNHVLWQLFPGRILPYVWHFSGVTT